MRRIVGFDIELSPATNANGVTDAIPCVVPLEAFVIDGHAPSIDNARVTQATKVSVQVTLEDAASDASLVVGIEKTIDQTEWINQANTGSFESARSVLVGPFDSTGIGWVRANVTTAAASATRARVTFILTRAE